MHISLYIILIFLYQSNASRVKVNLKQGIIFGIKEMTVFEQKLYIAFYGVPYARAPVGRLRFQNPKPVKGYLKPYDASTEYHGACAQAHIVHKHALYGYEDCLRLNIYTPGIRTHEKQKLKAIIVWIHGYAFTSSFSHVYGPDFLIEHDILFISLTHRIGPFGFLKVNESDSNVNMGLKDIITGLKWIRNNIKHFGGDKNKIALMGSGSGGTIVTLLLLTKYRKLFQKVIIHSGTMYSPSIFQGSNTLERFRLQNELEKAGHKDYKKAPTQDIVAAWNKIYTSKEIIDLQKPLVPFSPVIEQESNNSLITKSDFTKYEKDNGDFNISILTGFTTQESLPEVIPFIHNPSYLQSLVTNFKYMAPFRSGCSYNYTTKIYKSIANKITRKYFKSYPEVSLNDFLKYTSDNHKYSIYKFIQTHLLHNGSNMFVYKFNYNGRFNSIKTTSLAGIKTRVKGAAQGDELCYLLKCEPLWESYVKIKSDVNNRDRNFIKQITTMWANFAIYGNPTPAGYTGNITWPPMTSKEDNLLFIGNRYEVINSKKELKMYEFWNKIYDNYYSPKHCNTAHDEL